MSRGLKNNNPGNIRHNNDLFQGEIRPSTDSAFKQFSEMKYGYRAMFVSLATYLTKYGRNTIEKIISAWAPANENNTAGYIAHVEQFSGVGRRKVLSLSSGDDYIKIVAAMSRIENGIPAVSADVRAGFDLQTKLKSRLY
jgi:hypothetical protein